MEKVLITIPNSWRLLLLLLIAIPSVYPQVLTFGNEAVAVKDTNLIIFSGHAKGGALYVSGTTLHNGVFTDTEFDTAAGRQSLTSKSSNAYGKLVWKCAVASKTASIYACLMSDGPTKGQVVYVSVDPTTTAAPVATVAGLSNTFSAIACQGDYCYGVMGGGGQAKVNRFTSTPGTGITAVTCAGDSSTSTYLHIDETQNLSLHGMVKIQFIKTNVDNTVYQLTGNAITFDLGTPLAGKIIYEGTFLTYTGFTDKVLLLVGGTNADQLFKLTKISDGSFVAQYGPVNVGAGKPFDEYISRYITSFLEVPNTAMILITFYHLTTKTTVCAMNYATETGYSVMSTTAINNGHQPAIYPGTKRILLPTVGAANDMMSSRDEIQFCADSCKTCGTNTTPGFSECTECLNAAHGIFTDNVSCKACPANSTLQLKKCVCGTGRILDKDFTCDTCAPGYVKKGTDCVEQACFSAASVATTGLTAFGQIAVWDGRSQKKLVLVYNKAINFSASDIDKKLKLSSVKLDGSDPVAIADVTLTTKTSLNLLNLSYGTEVPADRSIKIESLTGFKLISEAADTINDLSAQFCPKTDSDIAISQAIFLGNNLYMITLKKLSTTANTFKTKGEIDSISYALLGTDKVGEKQSLIYKTTSNISQDSTIIFLDLSQNVKDGISGEQEVVVFYHAGQGISGDNAEDKKYISENFMPLMVQLTFSTPLGTISKTLVLFISVLICLSNE